MAFTAGSVELAKANKLGSQLAHLFSTFGTTGAAGTTGAKMIEKYAKKAGFGITGLTTGAAFPPFGTVLPSLGTGLEAALQNPRGETMANGITLGALEGQTVGIYLRKFINSGAGYQATMFTGLTTAAATTVAGTTFQINGAFTAHTNDLVVIGSTSFKITSGITSSLAGGKSEVTVSPAIGAVYALNTTLSLQSVGVTRGTSGVAGSTTEAYAKGTVVNGGFTAAVYFNSPSGGSGTWVVS
tara:strand:- start:853 stop:1578 length:726 start_codon:yes stop_codon:yes gene_type:complete